MNRQQKKWKLGGVLLLAGLLLAGWNILSAREKSFRPLLTKTPPAGLERLGAADLSPEKKAEIRQFIRDGGLFFNRPDFLGEIMRGCGDDCNYCCCDPDGKNCYCCD